MGRLAKRSRNRIYRWLGVVSPSSPPARAEFEAWLRTRPFEPGPLTRFSTGAPEHVCGDVCDPGHPRHRPCFQPVPYEPQKGSQQC